MNSSERIIFNSIILYAKLIITIGVNLVATRFILNAMGVEDYGVVNLISGIVAMLTFVQNSMAISTQRYMSVNMGKKDVSIQRAVFNNGMFLHLILGIIIVVVLESCLPLVFNSDIKIPADRHSASVLLYQLTIIGTFLVVIGVPFDATLNARENMLWASFASILESTIRLTGAIWLLYYQNDKLIFYGLLVVAIRLSSFLFKSIYCKIKYEEVAFSRHLLNKKLIKEMFSFSFWNMFGSFAMAAKSQGVAVVLNVFNGVVINTAYGIGAQVSGQLANFSGTISRSMSPQIMQREGSGNRIAMASLALKQSRFTTLFMFMVALPLYSEMPYVLQIWLKTVPDYAIEFCRLFLLIALVTQMSSGLMTAIQARGKIAAYQIIMSILLLLSIPVAYLLQKIGYSPLVVMWAIFFIEIICLIIRVVMAKSLVGISGSYFLHQVVYKLSIVVVPTTIAVLLCKIFLVSSLSPFVQLLISISITLLLVTIVSYISFDSSEKELANAFVRKIMQKIIGKKV